MIERRSSDALIDPPSVVSNDSFILRRGPKCTIESGSNGNSGSVSDPVLPSNIGVARWHGQFAH